MGGRAGAPRRADLRGERGSTFSGRQPERRGGGGRLAPQSRRRAGPGPGRLQRRPGSERRGRGLCDVR
eukprot:11178872-Lingulodinium_polyedra.AAC.1